MDGEVEPKSTPSDTQLEFEYRRLHITPLNPALLTSILPPSVLPLARNISYHSIQTFAEKEFGFLDLPAMEGQKIKKKLNGSVLKGTKVKIEDARPLKQASEAKDSVVSISKMEKTKMPSKKRKRDTETVPAVELKDRKVKRGWTDPTANKRSDKRSKDKKDIIKSKYTSKPECLFKTTLPANVAASLKDGTGAANSKPERKKKSKHDKEVIVHEFSKTIKHATFLRSSRMDSTAKGVTEYMDGKGWVDADGNVVEAPAINSKKGKIENDPQAENSTDSSASSVVEDSSEDKSAMEEVGVVLSRVSQKLAVDDSSTSSSGTSSSGDSSDEEDANLSETETSEPNTDKVLMSEKDTKNSSLPQSPGTPGTPGSLKIEIPKSTGALDLTGSVHPLEALFKRRRPNLEAPTIPDSALSFSFFDAGAEDDDREDVTYSIPMTPYTRQDFEFRGLRSAAPTPDTAHPGKTYDKWPVDSTPQEPSDAGDATPTQKGKGFQGTRQADSQEAQVSDFQKWFYENRGEANRAWKKKRKLAAKEKRHRENKKRNGRAV